MVEGIGRFGWRVRGVFRCLMITVLLAAAVACGSDPRVQEGMDAEAYFTELRERMVVSQIEGRGVHDTRVLSILRKVPRHRFVPEEQRLQAYEDYPLPIGYGQTISQPYIVGLMTELLSLDGTERVLEVGTGSGYQAAVLSGLAAEVYTIEIIPELAARADSALNEAGCKNVWVRAGDGYAGWPEKAPFDAIIVTAAPERIPQALAGQLKTGGRLVIPVGRESQELLLAVKTDGQLNVKSIIPVKFVPMVRERTEL